MKVLFDTNVYISQALTGGAAREVVAATLRARWRVFASEHLLEEVERVMIEKLGRSPQIARKVTRIIAKESRITRIGSSRHRVPRDANDDPVLVAAVFAGVDYLVSNDGDLLSLDPYEGVRIVSVAAFHQVLREHGLL